MKKSILLLFICLIISGFAYSKTLFSKKGRITNTYTNQFNDPDWSLEISCADEEGAFINGICYIKEGCKVTVNYDSAIVGGRGDGTQYGSGGSETKTDVYITKPGKNSNKITGNTTIVCNKDDCYCVDFCISGNNTESEPEFVVKICTVNKIYGFSEEPYIICNGNIYYYSGRIISGSSIDPYYLLIHCENVYAVNSSDSFPKFYVRKNSKIQLNYDGASITDEASLYKTKRYTSLSTSFELNKEQNIDKNTDVILSICQTGMNYSEHILQKLSFITDDNPPEITAYPEKTNGEWYAETVEISGNDAETGIKQFEIKKEGSNTPEYYTNENGTVIPLTESGKYKITAEDYVGNVSTKDVWIDKEKPVIRITNKEGSKITANEKGWYTNEELKICAEDNLAGTGSFSVNEETKQNPYLTSENGIYKIKVADKAGNESEDIIKLDNKKPVIENFTLQYFKKNEDGTENRLIKKIAAAATAKEEDINSGLETVYIKNGEQSILAGGNAGELNRKNWKLTAETAEINRSRLNTYDLKVSATDLAGNTNGIKYGTINLPPEIKLSIGNTYIENINTENCETVTELTLGGYKGNEDYYETIKLLRRFYIDGRQITEENFTKYFEESARENWRNLTSWITIPKKDIQNGIYKDRIPSLSGFGHKETGYIVNWELKDCEENGMLIREESKEYRKVTSDYEGKISITIEGRSQQFAVDFESGKIKEDPDEIKLAGDGGIRIGVKIEDADSEPYEVELRQKIITENENDRLSISKPGFIQKGITGFAKYEGYEEKYEKEKCNWYDNKEYLNYNREICLYLRIKSGYSGNKTVKESGYIYLKAEPDDLGGFFLKVCKQAEYTERGITASPHQKISMELEGVTQNADWDYGDGAKEYSCLNVEHSWNQKEGRNGDTSEYNLNIKAEGKNAASIPVHIVDTRAGSLYGDEIWIGTHEVSGKIKVPENMTLRIGTENNDQQQRIICIADEDDYAGCIQVQSGGMLYADNKDGGIKFVSGINTKEGIAEPENKEEPDRLYWNGIEVLPGGKSELSGIEIKGGRRALAVDKYGFATIKKSVLRENMTALHIFGECKTEETEITDNAEYGIKEEEGSRCEIKKSYIYDNTVDWYEKEDGPLSEEEIRAKIGG